MRILLVVYDNGSYLHQFPLGLAYIAAVLRQEGMDVEIYSQDIHHYADEHLTEYLDSQCFDVVAVGVIGGYYQYRKLLGLSEAINRSKKRPFYMIGGHGPSPEPGYFLEKTGADVVVIGEGERTVVELLEAWGAGRSLAEVKGIAYRDGADLIVTERQPLIEDLDSIPWPAYDLFPIEIYRLMRMPHTAKDDFVMAMLTSRGCPYRCNFCYRMDPGFRLRSNKSIIEEMLFLQKTYRISYFFFADELVMSSLSRMESLCQDIIRAKLKVKWFCAGRLNFARPDLLRMMKEAGCVYVSYGIEAMDDVVLKNMQKNLTTKQIISGIEATLAAGISPGFNVIFGNLGESRETLEKGVEFLLKYDDGSQLRTIRPVTPYPGSALYDYAIEQELLKDCADFYESKHSNSDLLAVNFTEMSNDEFHESLFEANERLLSNYYQNSLAVSIDDARRLYLEQDTSFRGFRQS